MANAEVISHEQAVVETTSGKARQRVMFALEQLGKLEPGQDLRIEPDEGETARSYRIAFAKAAAALGMKVRLRLVGDVLYVMVEEAQEGSSTPAGDPSEAEPVAQEGTPRQRADAMLAETKALLDAELEKGTCPWGRPNPHSHDPSGKCLGAQDKIAAEAAERA